MNFKQNFNEEADRSALLTALISGGLIGGTVSLIQGNFEKSKYIFPAALILGIFADYQVNKYRNYEEFEKISNIDETNQDPEYLLSMLKSAMTVLTILGTGYISSRSFDHFYTGFPFNDWYQDTNQLPNPVVANEQDGLPEVEMASGISFVANPAVAQIGIALASGGVRRAGKTLIAQVVLQSFRNINLRDTIEKGIIAGKNVGTILNTQLERLSDSLTDLFSRRVEGSHLTNESTLVLSNADQTESYVILQPSNSHGVEAPVIRLKHESFEDARKTFHTVEPVDLTKVHELHIENDFDPPEMPDGGLDDSFDLPEEVDISQQLSVNKISQEDTQQLMETLYDTLINLPRDKRKSIRDKLHELDNQLFEQSNIRYLHVLDLAERERQLELSESDSLSNSSEYAAKHVQKLDSIFDDN